MKYLPSLDGLRGVAVLMVIYSHFPIPKPDSGFVGVTVFFVLSGFLITALLVSEWDAFRKIQLKKFYLRRVLRLFPALIVLVSAYLTVAALFAPDFKAHLKEAAMALTYVMNWMRVAGVHRTGYLAHTWSLSIEEQFYVLWPLLLILGLRTVRSRILLIVLIAAAMAALIWFRFVLIAHGGEEERIYNGLDTRADALLLGCTLGVAYASHLLPKGVLMARCVRFASVISFLGLFWIAAAADQVSENAHYFLCALFPFFIIMDMALAETGIVHALLTMPGMVWIGKISYGLYLWHYPILLLVARRASWPMACRIVCGVAGSFFLAVLSYYVVEKPYLRRKRRLSVLRPVAM